MRYSLKSLIAISSFVPIAIIAFLNPGTLWVDVLCWASAFVFLYAVLAVMFSRMHGRAAATGYVLFTGTYLLALWVLPMSLPAQKLVQYGPYKTLSDADRDDLQAELNSVEANLQKVRSMMRSPAQFESRYESMKAAVIKRFDDDRAAHSLLVAIHAVSTVIVGICGALLAGYLYAKNHEKSAPSGA